MPEEISNLGKGDAASSLSTKKPEKAKAKNTLGKEVIDSPPRDGDLSEYASDKGSETRIVSTDSVLRESATSARSRRQLSDAAEDDHSSASSSTALELDTPGAVRVSGITAAAGDTSDDDDEEVTMAVPIEAHLVRNETQIVEEQVEKRLEEKLQERLEKERKDIVHANAIPVHTVLGMSKTTFIGLVVIGLLLVAVVAIVVGVVLGKANKEPSTDSPTLAPTIYRSEALDNLWNAIGSSISDNDDLESILERPDTPQYQALGWLANTDAWFKSTQVDGDTTTMPLQALVERYALAVLYYSTRGHLWQSQFNFLTDVSICEWWLEGYGVQCNGESQVTSLTLDYQLLRGSIPSELALLENLEHLGLSGNILLGSVPAGLFSLTSLKFLSLRECQLTGTLPTEVGVLANLTSLDLSDNSLTGAIPSEFGACASLGSLAIYNNALNGPIPTHLGGLSNLYELTLNDNRLTGGIPSELGNCQFLGSMSLSGNQLTGTVPTDLGRLMNLYQLNISVNELIGAIPVEFTYMTALQQLDIQENALEGDIDEVFCWSEQPSIFVTADCLGDDPRIACSCCTTCCDETECQTVSPPAAEAGDTSFVGDAGITNTAPDDDARFKVDSSAHQSITLSITLGFLTAGFLVSVTTLS